MTSLRSVTPRHAPDAVFKQVRRLIELSRRIVPSCLYWSEHFMLVLVLRIDWSCKNGFFESLSLNIQLIPRAHLWQFVNHIRNVFCKGEASPPRSKRGHMILTACALFHTGRICTLISVISCDSSVGIALGYGLDDRGSRFRFPAGAGNFSLHHCVRNGSVAHPASYPMGTRGSFPGG
jgi:hypothetical protein